MATRINLTYCGWETSGATVREAKQNAAREITAALSANYDPIVVECRGHAILAWRTPHGWRYKTIARPDDGFCGDSPSMSTINNVDRKDVRSILCGHLAQVAWTPEDGETPPIALDDSNMRDFVSWARWQGRYRLFREQGMSDCDAHREACFSV